MLCVSTNDKGSVAGCGLNCTSLDVFREFAGSVRGEKQNGCDGIGKSATGVNIADGMRHRQISNTHRATQLELKSQIDASTVAIDKKKLPVWQTDVKSGGIISYTTDQEGGARKKVDQSGHNFALAQRGECSSNHGF